MCLQTLTVLLRSVNLNFWQNWLPSAGKVAKKTRIKITEFCVISHATSWKKVGTFIHTRRKSRRDVHYIVNDLHDFYMKEIKNDFEISVDDF